MSPEDFVERLVVYVDDMASEPISRDDARNYITSLLEQVLEGQADRVAELEAAIRAHRDQRGDDRCWMDDMSLYAALSEGVPDPGTLCLHEPEEMLANCRRFVASRQPGGLPYVSPQREIERLEAEVRCLQALCQGLADRVAAQSELLTRRAGKGGAP